MTVASPSAASPHRPSSGVDDDPGSDKRADQATAALAAGRAASDQDEQASDQSGVVAEGAPKGPADSSAGERSRSAREKWRRKRRRERLRSATIEARQSIALTTLAVLAVLTAFYFARAILMPMALAVILTLTFRPSVRLLKRRGVPLFVSAGLIIFSLVGVALSGASYLAVPAQNWVEGAPDDLREVANRLGEVREQLTKLQVASEKLEDLASGKAAADAASGISDSDPAPSTPADLGSQLDGNNAATDAELDVEEPVAVEVKQPRLITGLQALGSAGTIVGSIVLTLVLSFFLLSAGDTLINNVLHILPSMREKRNVVELVYKVERGISSYLSTVTCINVGLGICEGLAMWALGMPNPALWGVMATLLNFVPYLGAMVGTLVVFLVAVLSFDSMGYAALVPAVYFSLTALEGNFVTPTLLGRSMSLNPVMVFLSLTFWAWMWGIVGALLAVPILAMLKIGFDQFERTRPVGTLLGE